MPRGNLDDPAAFASVARERSFTRAAAELRLSTSALSYTIKKLTSSRIGSMQEFRVLASGASLDTTASRGRLGMRR